MSALAGSTLAGMGSILAAAGEAAAAGSGVTQIVAGSAIGISPGSGVGVVTVNNTGVRSIIAGTGIGVSGATGNVTITATGGGPPTLTATQVGFGSASNLLTGSTKFLWTDAATSEALDMTGSGTLAPLINLRSSSAPAAGGPLIGIKAFVSSTTAIGAMFFEGLTSGNFIGMDIFQSAPGAIDFFTIQGTGGVGLAPFSAFTQLFDVILGKDTTIAAAGVNGFVWLPTITATPSGVPAFEGDVAKTKNRKAIALDNTNLRTWGYLSGAWHFSQFMDYDPTVAGRIPFVGATTHTLTDSANLSWTDTVAGEHFDMQGSGASAVLPLNIRNTTASGSNSFVAVRAFQNTSTQFAQLLFSHVGGGVNTGLMSITQSAASAEDTFSVSGTAAGGQPPLGVYTQNKDVLIASSAQIAAAGTRGYLFQPTIATTPTGVPALDLSVAAASRKATAVDDTNFRYYAYVGAGWHFSQMMDYDPGANAGRVPFVGATAHTLADSAALTFGSGVTTNRLTVGSASSPGPQGAILVNSNTKASGTGIPIGGGGGGQGAGLYVADPFGGGEANIAVDDFFFGQSLIGYTNLNLSDLSIGTGTGHALTFKYLMTRLAAGNVAGTVDGTTGEVTLGVVTSIDCTPAGDVQLGTSGPTAGATTGFPYIPSRGTPFNGALVKPFGNRAALGYCTNNGFLQIFDPIGNTWVPIPPFNVIATAGAGAASIANLPAGVGTTAKWWQFKDSAGTNTYIPFFQ